MSEEIDEALKNFACEPYVATAIDAFLNDPPDSDFQRGYLAALVAVYKEAIGRPAADARIIAAEKL